MAEESSTFRSNLRKIMVISTFGGLLFGYDTGVVNGALPLMAAPDQLNLDPLQEGMVVSALLVSASVTVPAYLAEISPAETRGRMVTQNELMIVSGQFLAFVVNAIIAVIMEGDNYVWRYMLAVAALPAIVLFFGIRLCPESPRWLVAKHRPDDSFGVLKISFLFSMQTFLGPILWLSISEIIPLRFRGFGMGCCVIFLWITNFVIGLVFPSLLANLGLQMTFIIFAAIGFISITFTRLCVPETMGKTLEQIEHQFRNYNREEIQSVGHTLQEH